jgi:hypothetical protein
VRIHDRCAKGLDVGVDLLVNLGDGGIDGVDGLEQQAQNKAMMLGHTAPQRGLQFGRCRFDPPMRQRRQRLRIGLAADQGLDHPPPDKPMMSAMTESSLMLAYAVVVLNVRTSRLTLPSTVWRA